MEFQRVAVLGASPKPERYSNLAVHGLIAHGHTVIPVHPTCDTIAGIATARDLSSIADPVDTLTVYVGARHSEQMIADVVALAPKRVILNPGAEADLVERALTEQGIEVVKACTLVLLATGQFELDGARA